ncbi:hypothetical protein BDN72DRAFT_831435 [Pluteus cervinus]|uniref:Uncharacterized protein n=1 Tax=Pluteus cervinus TaxID=181527 RepID=A0ACD3BDR2_9AGAR|nr:hypothetical protein BDN72DRAFT_831435 [Pluteus cervinus]
MSLAVLARASLRRQQGIARSFHSTGPARSAGHDYHPFPFSFPRALESSSKAALGFKVFAFLSTGFAIPFIAAGVQLKKAGA